jgi:hypothetical protein
VDNAGNFTTKGDGTALVKVATDDGEYAQFCAVSSFTSIGGEFTPLT